MRYAFILVMVILSYFQIFAEDTVTYRNNNERNGVKNEVVPPEFTLLWINQISNQPIYSSPISYSGMLYVCNADGDMYLIDANTGQVRYTYNGEGYFFSTPALYRGSIYAGTTGGYFYSLQARTLQNNWTIQHNRAQISSPLVQGDMVIFGLGASSNEVSAYERLNGNFIWSFEAQQMVYSSPSSDGQMIFVGSNDGRIYSLNLANGNRIYDFSTNGLIHKSTPAVWGNYVVFVSSGYVGNIFILDKNTGALVRTITPSPALNIPIFTSSPAVNSNGTIFIVHCDAVFNSAVYANYYRYRIYAIDMISGTTLWYYDETLPTEGVSMLSSPVVSGDIVYFAWGNRIFARNFSGTIVPLDPNDLNGDGRTDFIETPGNIYNDICLANGMMFVATYTGNVCAYQSVNYAPSAPTILSPAQDEIVNTQTPTIDWNDSIDRNNNLSELRYILAYSFTGDPEINGGTEVVTNSGDSMYAFTQQVPRGTTVYFRMRALDPMNALSEWTALRRFSISREEAPEDPRNLIAIPRDTSVLLMWQPSPSEIEGYNLYYKRATESWSNGRLIRLDDDVTSYTVNNLVNLVTYDFQLRAVNEEGIESKGVIVSATPFPAITINNNPNRTFRTIQLAINLARRGETVTVGSGIFRESVTLKRGVSLRGYAPGLTILIGRSNRPAIRVVGNSYNPAFNISNMSISGEGNGIEINGNPTVNISNLIIAELEKNGVLIRNNSTVNIVNCTIEDNEGDGVRLDFSRRNNRRNLSSVINIRNTTIGNNDGYGINNLSPNNYSVVVRYSDLYENGKGATSNVEVDRTNISERAMYNYRDIERYLHYLDMSNSPTIDRGDPNDEYPNEPLPNGSRINIGAYGNTRFAADSQ